MPEPAYFDTSKNPPGGWLYREKIKGRWFSVKDSMQPFLVVSAEIQAWRRNNGMESKLSGCVTELRRYTMRRFGLDPDGGGVAAGQQAAATESGSACCGRQRA
jgi:hypothetical protein